MPKTKTEPVVSSISLADLHPAQLQAVTHGQGPLLIVAGAGTGKTTVITRRLAWLILEKGLKPEEILALTFTDKAATEMSERVDRLLPYGYVELWISTFHAFAERILRAHALEIGLPSDFKLLDTTAAWLLVRKNLARFSLRHYQPLGNPTKFIHALLTHFSRAKDELISPANYLDYLEGLKLNQDQELIISGEKITPQLRSGEMIRLEEIAEAYHVYEQLLLEENALDFGGLINRAIELLGKRPAILQKYRSQFKYLLVDEFQDTNYAQYELVKILAAPKNNLTVVADDDQSIYRFRGAAISNVLTFKQEFPTSREIFLVQNYRSRQNILDLAYAFIQQNNPHRLEVSLGQTGLSKKLFAFKDQEGILAHLQAETAENEAKLVVETILALRKKNQDGNWNDFAILVRANHQAGFFIRALTNSGLPYELVTARGLYTTPVIMDLLAYARLLDDYHESSACWRVLTSPISRLSDAVISQLLYWANRRAWSLFAVMRAGATFDFAPEIISELNRLVGLIEKHTSLARRLPASQVFFAILEETGYLKKLTQEDKRENQEAINHLNQFYHRLTAFEEENPAPILSAFLEEIKLEIESGEEGRLNFDPEAGPEAVKILTCHAAKGLEFRYVFVTNLVDRRFPSIERREPIELPDALVKEILTSGDPHLEEERRLFYVACTRAKEGLFFTSASDYGGARKKKISRFISELEALGYQDLLTRGPVKDPSFPLATTSKPSGRPGSNNFEIGNQFSFTKLKAFQICPLQYKYAHLLKIPVKGRPTFSFGKTIHATLQKFCELIRERRGVNQGKLFGNSKEGKQETEIKSLPVSFEELLKLYDQAWIDDWFEDAKQKQTYYEKGRALLKLFYTEAEKQPPRSRYLEQAFHLKINGYTLKGVIDRVDELPDGTLEVIDYKTGSSRAEEDVDKNQLYIYQIALAEVLGGSASVLTFYYVEDGKKVSFIGLPADLEKIKEKIRVQIEEMKTSSFPATPAKEKCRACDFKHICEFRIL